MTAKIKKKFDDEAGFALLNNYSIWAYRELSAAESWLYLCLQAYVPGLHGEIPGADSPLIPLSQRRLAMTIQMPYSTFRVYLKDLREWNLVATGTRQLRLLAPDPEEVRKAYQAKIGLCRSKQDKCVKEIGYTMVPRSLIHGYPELLPAAKFVYVLIKSLDWTGKGFVWHSHRRIAALAGLKLRTFRKYLRDLQDAKLICFSKKIGPSKATVAIHYNNSSAKEQERAKIFKACGNHYDAKNFYRPVDRLQENSAFELIWHSLHPQKKAA